MPPDGVSQALVDVRAEASSLARLLRKVGEQLGSISGISVDEVALRYIEFFAFFKAEKTFHAVIVLVDNKFAEDAACLFRVQFELALFVEYLKKSPSTRVMRFLDFQDVDLAKYLECGAPLFGSDLSRVCSPDRRKELRQAEKLWKKKGRKKQSWTDDAIDQMAKEVGWQNAYNVLYRLYTGFIHPNPRAISSYISETDVGFAVVAESPEAELTRVLKMTCLYTGYLAGTVADEFGLPVAKEVEEVVRAMGQSGKWPSEEEVVTTR